MISARTILVKIQEISRHYFSGKPPIDVNGLSAELKAPKEEILHALRELEKRELISFYHSTRDAIKLTQKGANTIPR
jgi:Mn-dependent DtxR family transcriptional regulator